MASWLQNKIPIKNHYTIAKSKVVERTATHEWHDLNQMQKPVKTLEEQKKGEWCKSHWLENVVVVVSSLYSLTFLWDCWLIIESTVRVSRVLAEWHHEESLLPKNHHSPVYHVMLNVILQLSSVFPLFSKDDKGLKINFKDVLSVHVPLVERENKGHFLHLLTSHRVTSPGISIVLVLLPGGEKAMAILALVQKLLILEINFLTRHCPESRARLSSAHQELKTVL